MEKDWLSSALQVEVKGSQWGLGCNGVHFIHLARFLTKTKFVFALSADVKELAEGNKRGSAYSEYCGMIQFKLGDRHRLSLESTQAAGLPFSIRILNSQGETLISIAEDHGLIKPSEGPDWKLGVSYVSETTRQFTEDYLAGSQVLLPTFAESKEDHLALFNGISLSIGPRIDYRIT
jgi:hypothetical protein